MKLELGTVMVNPSTTKKVWLGSHLFVSNEEIGFQISFFFFFFFFFFWVFKKRLAYHPLCTNEDFHSNRFNLVEDNVDLAGTGAGRVRLRVVDKCHNDCWPAVSEK
jgi:hypothetical protein